MAACTIKAGPGAHCTAPHATIAGTTPQRNSAGDGRVCAARKDGPCMLTFTQEGSTWRLSGFDPQAANLHFKR